MRSRIYGVGSGSVVHCARKVLTRILCLAGFSGYGGWGVEYGFQALSFGPLPFPFALLLLLLLAQHVAGV